MSRLSFRPRPLDIHKKLPIVKSVKDLDIDEPSIAPRAHSTSNASLDGECDLVLAPAKKAATGASEIPTPQFLVVDSYERDYTRSFVQPPSYIRGRPARSENAEFCEYDMDSDDEAWLVQFNSERKILPAEKFEMMLYRLEIMDHRAAEKQGSLVSVLGSPIPVVLNKELAIEALKTLVNRPAVLGAVYEYWKLKREAWQKPVLRRLQPPPPVNDTNPFNVFRPREKIHRPHTRRMQRRENDVQSFERLRQVRSQYERTQQLLLKLLQREGKKRELVEVEINIQRMQLRLKVGQYGQQDAVRLEDDGAGLVPSKFGRAEDGHRFPFKDHVNGSGRSMSLELTPTAYDAVNVNDQQELRRPRRRPRFPHARNHVKEKKSLEPSDPVLLFTKPLDSGKLAAAGIVCRENEANFLPFCLSGRIGRGGRIVYDRWDPLTGAPYGSHGLHMASLPFAAPVDRFGSRPLLRRVVDPLVVSDAVPSAEDVYVTHTLPSAEVVWPVAS